VLLIGQRLEVVFEGVELERLEAFARELLCLIRDIRKLSAQLLSHDDVLGISTLKATYQLSCDVFFGARLLS
jgi:hypothetical protein